MFCLRNNTFLVNILVRKCKNKQMKQQEPCAFLVCNCKQKSNCGLHSLFLTFLTPKTQRPTAGQKTTTKKITFILQITLGNRVYTYIADLAPRVRPPARTHERNDFPVGPLGSHPSTSDVLPGAACSHTCTGDEKRHSGVVGHNSEP